jgi:hypothetical protein
VERPRTGEKLGTQEGKAFMMGWGVTEGFREDENMMDR